jgi:hypothetical protein
MIIVSSIANQEIVSPHYNAHKVAPVLPHYELYGEEHKSLSARIEGCTYYDGSIVEELKGRGLLYLWVVITLFRYLITSNSS